MLAPNKDFNSFCNCSIYWFTYKKIKSQNWAASVKKDFSMLEKYFQEPRDTVFAETILFAYCTSKENKTRQNQESICYKIKF